MASGSKRRIEDAAGDLLSRHGYHGLGLKALSAEAGLPYGSIYHHFPGGKDEIAAAAIDAAGERSAGLLRAVATGREAAEVVELMFAAMAGRLAASEWQSGCPIGTPAMDGAVGSEPVRRACDRALDGLVAALAETLTGRGLPGPRADALAVTLTAAYEGAAMMARVQRSEEPLKAVGATMADLVRRVFDEPGA